MNILTVTQINNQVKYAIESQFSEIWIRGEVVNPVLYPSGHMYFSLKDEKSIISCVYFLANHSLSSLSNGTQVVISGKVSLYPLKGKFQFIVKNVYNEGEGDLWKKFEYLKQKLKQEGLFLDLNKKPIPKYPKIIGLITSEQGAVLWDILHDFKGKKIAVTVIIKPTKVQGKNASNEIISSISDFEEHDLVDVIILARGGGSQEDLMPFNDESLARKIHSTNIPIISAIGHETDFTISDFVSDKRVPTPSYAAELLTRSLVDQRQLFDNYINRINQSIKIQISYKINKLDNLNMSSKLLYFKKEINNSIDNLDLITNKIVNRIVILINNLISILKDLESKMNLYNPNYLINKGFPYVFDINNQGINSIKQLKLGEILQIKLKDGNILTKITKIE